MTNTTRAAVMWGAGKPWDVVELSLDDPKDFEVLVRLEAAGLCHSDDHVRTGDQPVRYPIVGGHEGAGVVEKIGPGVTHVSVGDRIIVSYIPVCGVCTSCLSGQNNMCDRGLHTATGKMVDGTFRYHSAGEDVGGFCATGTFSERMVINETACIPLPDDIPFEIGALLGCGVPTGWGSAVKAAKVQPGETVVIYGVGGIGMNAVQGASLAGALRVVVVDPVAMKRERALEFGATHTFSAHQEALDFVRESTWGKLANHSIITVGVNNAEVFGQALDIVGKNGQVTVTASGPADEKQISANVALVIGYQKRIQGTMFGSASLLKDTPILIDLYRAGKLKLDELISQRYTLDGLNEATADMLEGRNIRGVITFGG